MTELTTKQLAAIKERFYEYDTDNSGSISLVEFKKLLSDYLDDNQINEMLNRMDENHDGTISFNEFVNANE